MDSSLSTGDEGADLDPLLPRSRDELSSRLLVRLAVYALAVITISWHLFYAYTYAIPRPRHSNIHLGLLLTTYYLTTLDFEPDDWHAKLRNAISVLMLGVTVVATVYVHLNFYRFLTEVRSQLIYSNIDLLIGILIIVVSIHATWRAYGRLLGGIAIVALAYGYFGPLFPGIFNHSGISAEALIRMNSIALNGVYGFILQVGATWVALFIFFAAMVKGYGGMQYVIALGRKAGKTVATGVPQVAVIASMIIGSITGSSAANVASTGSFTIPLMKNNKIEPKFAAAIESVASTGGQILPPVMGSAAFIMADIIGVSYFDIVQGGLFPALLFYLSTAVTIHLAATKYGWALGADESLRQSSDGTEDQGLRDILVNTLPYTVSLAILMYTLIVLRWNPLTAGFYTIVAVIGSGLIRELLTATSVQVGVSRFGRRTIEGFKLGIEDMAPLTAVVASLGIVVRTLTQTGLTQKISLRMLAIAGGSFLLLLILAMAASILFGMGMPTPAAYIVVAVLSAPALLEFGVRPITAHMFVFYFALLSTITPPIALSVAVSAGIAGSSFWETAKETLRLGTFVYVIPFIFVRYPELIYWQFPRTLLTFGVASVAMVMLAMGLIGHDFVDRLSPVGRTAHIILAGLTLAVPIPSLRYGLATITLVWVTVHLAGYDIKTYMRVPSLR
ncbi:TRAP transporter permease [Halobacteriales archaeon Cl-PHB]